MYIILLEGAKCGYFTRYNKVIDATLIPYLCTTIQRLSCTFKQSLQDTLGGPQPQFSELKIVVKSHLSQSHIKGTMRQTEQEEEQQS